MSIQDYLRQARFAAEMIGVDIEFAQMSVYDVGALGERFDVVLFLGVLYHLRHPLLGARSDPRARRPATCLSASRCSAAIQAKSRSTRITRSPRQRSSTPELSAAVLHRAPLCRRQHELVGSEPRLHRGDAAQRRFCDRGQSGGGGLRLPADRAPTAFGAVYPARARAASARGGRGMIEAAMLWNEPNNKSHWDLELDPDWARFASMARLGRRRDRGGGAGPAAGARRHFADRPAVHRQSERARCAGAARCRRGARLSARLESVDDRRVAGKARRDRRGRPTCRSGSPRSALRASAPRRCRNSVCSAPPSC